MEAFKVDIPDGKYLGKISSDFVKISDQLKEASYQIRKSGFEYPVFPISQVEVSIGQLLFEKTFLSIEWNYYASYLNEFMERELIVKEKEEDFKQVYKDPDEYCCLFIIDEDHTQFIFIPYPED